MDIRGAEEKQLRYQAIYKEIKNEIIDGGYLQGSFLPTESQLMEKYHVSRTTVRRALSLLQKEELIETSQGRGSQVLKGKSRFRQTEYHIAHDVTSVSSLYLQGGTSGSSSSIVDIVRAEQKIVANLQVEPLSEVYRIQRLKFRGDIPFDFVTSYVPAHLTPGLERFSGQIFWLHKCLSDNYRIRSSRVEERIYAAAATFLEANLLHISAGSPLLVISRTAWRGDEIMEYTESRFRTDVFQICLSMSGQPDYLKTEEARSTEILTLL